MKAAIRATWMTCLLTVGALSAPVAVANLVTNGSFESPGFDPTEYPEYSHRYLYDGSTLIDGWTASDDGIGEAPYWLNNTDPWYANSTHDGTYAIVLNQGSGVSTAVSVVAGTTYRLSFWMYGGNGAGGTHDPLKVDVAGFTTTFALPGGGVPPSGWMFEEFVFAATSTGSVALAFTNTSGVGDYKNYGLDDIRLEPVPLPAAAWLLLSGLGGLSFLRRRKTH